MGGENSCCCVMWWCGRGGLGGEDWRGFEGGIGLRIDDIFLVVIDLWSFFEFFSDLGP